MNLDDCTELWRTAFAPLRARLTQQVERIRRGDDPHNQFSPWLVCTGKGGAAYLDYPDISLYRHCMDVGAIACMLLSYAWQAGRLAWLAPNDTQGAARAFRRLWALAFLHDADKYRDQDGTPSRSHSPTLPDVQAVYEVLEMAQWADLSLEDSFALVSRVEHRGIAHALLASAPADPTTDLLAAMVAEGDKLASIASRPPTVRAGSSGQGMPSMARRLVETYNEPSRLRVFVQQYAVPDERLRLLEFRQAPAVLHYLRRAFLEALYDAERLPLVCLLNGESLAVSVPESFDLEQVFTYFTTHVVHTTPSIKRNATNGEVALLHIHDVDALIRVMRETADPRLLTVHAADWDIVQPYLRAWVGATGGLALAERRPEGKLLLAVERQRAAAAEGVVPERYAYALTLACALRSDASGTVFDSRLRELQRWHDGCVPQGLQASLPDVDLDRLDKNTRQTLYAMQAAMEIPSEAALHALIAQVHPTFPVPEADRGTQAIVDSLRRQCGCAVEDADTPVYAPAVEGGTCLLTGAPATCVIEKEKMNLADINSSAFNNRMGHRKNLWSQADKNYLSDAALKQQALLCDLWRAAKKPALGQPALVAMPLRTLVKPHDSGTRGDMAVNLINSFMDVNENDAGWKQVLPWELDTSDALPLLLETMKSDAGRRSPSGRRKSIVQSRADAMYRMAVLALYSGDPVHVFLTAQRDIRAAFLFEPTPPLLQTLLRDLTVPGDTPGTVRRDRLPPLVQRLSLVRDVLAQPPGHDVLTALPAYGWWAIAWLHLRLVQEDKFFFASKVTDARKVYPMEHDSQLATIAALAQQVQRYPGPRASNNERTFALTTVLEPFTTGQHHGQVAAVTIAAMADTLEQALERRDLYTGGEGSLAHRCHAFAQEVYAFMRTHTNAGHVDGRFHRFMLAAYAHLFMTRSTTDQPEEDA